MSDLSAHRTRTNRIARELAQATALPGSTYAPDSVSWSSWANGTTEPHQSLREAQEAMQEWQIEHVMTLALYATSMPFRVAAVRELERRLTVARVRQDRLDRKLKARSIKLGRARRARLALFEIAATAHMQGSLTWNEIGTIVSDHRNPHLGDWT